MVAARLKALVQDHTRMAALHLGEAMGRDAAIPNAMTAYTPDPAHAAQMASGLLARTVGREALTLAFNDVFRLMAWMFVAALVMVPLCRPDRNAPPPPPDVAH